MQLYAKVLFVLVQYFLSLDFHIDEVYMIEILSQGMSCMSCVVIPWRGGGE